MKILFWLISRFKEPYSWAGFFMVASAFGFELTSQQQLALSVFGMALCGTPDEKINGAMSSLKGKFKSN